MARMGRPFPHLYDVVQKSRQITSEGRRVTGFSARVTQAPRGERCVCSRLYRQGDRHLDSGSPQYSQDLLDLILDALDAAWGDQRLPDEIAGKALRTAMAFQIMTAVGAGERDPGRLKRAALDATAGRTLDC